MNRGAAVMVVVLLGVQASVLAHGAESHSINAPRAFSPWDIAALASLIVCAVLYIRGSVTLARRGVRGRRLAPAAFAAGWLGLVVAILPPLDSLSIEQFSVHMIQHELMMLVGAPLLVLGRPLHRCLIGLPPGARSPLTRALQSPAGSGAWATLTTPLVAWALHGLAIWIWHMPAFYDAAVANEAIHALQHAMFVGTAALFWWGMLYGRYGRAGYGVAVFFVFLTVVHTGVLGAMVTFARTPLYPVYATPAAVYGIDQLLDQQRAGLLMWIPAGLVMTLLGLGLFAAWLGEAERRSAGRLQTRPLGGLPDGSEVPKPG